MPIVVSKVIFFATFGTLIGTWLFRIQISDAELLILKGGVTALSEPQLLC